MGTRHAQPGSPALVNTFQRPAKMNAMSPKVITKAMTAAIAHLTEEGGYAPCKRDSEKDKEKKRKVRGLPGCRRGQLDFPLIARGGGLGSRIVCGGNVL